MVTRSDGKIETFQQLLFHELGDLYDMEKQLVKALPKVMKQVTDPNLREAIHSHLEQTKNQVNRLEDSFQALSIKPRGVHCAGMKGLIKEGEEFLHQAKPSEVCDAGVIGMAQRMEHYEISGYGTAIAHANQLGASEVSKILEQNLREEKETDKKLTELAVRGVNPKALQESEA